MTVNELKDALALKALVCADMEREVTGCYIGDLLSWVMSRACEGDAWLTVMGNINAVGVAALADCSCIILTENASLDEEARSRAVQQQITILTSSQNSYHTALRIGALLQ